MLSSNKYEEGKWSNTWIRMYRSLKQTGFSEKLMEGKEWELIELMGQG